MGCYRRRDGHGDHPSCARTGGKVPGEVSAGNRGRPESARASRGKSIRTEEVKVCFQAFGSGLPWRHGDPRNTAPMLIGPSGEESLMAEEEGHPFFLPSHGVNRLRDDLSVSEKSPPSGGEAQRTAIKPHHPARQDPRRQPWPGSCLAVSPPNARHYALGLKRAPNSPRARSHVHDNQVTSS